MASKNQEYDALLEQYALGFGSTILPRIEEIIREVNRQLFLATTTSYGKVRAEAIGGFSRELAVGIQDLVRGWGGCNPSRTGWLVGNYAELFNHGLGLMPFRASFRSDIISTAQPGVQLEVLSRNERTDWLIEAYRTALDGRLIPPPTDFQPGFAHYDDQILLSGNAYVRRKMLLVKQF